MTSVGTNLAAFTYWSAEFPFLDRAKSIGNWNVIKTDYSWASGASFDLGFDAHGFPTKLPTGALMLQSLIAIDPKHLAMTDRYVVVYDGVGELQIDAATIVSKTPGKIVVEMTRDTDQPVQEMLVRLLSTDSADPLRALHVIREDQFAAWQSGEIFNPAFLEKIAGWQSLRFMEWGAINENEDVHWADRTTLDEQSWFWTGQERQEVPIEVMVALCNKTGADMWYCIPTKADDDYVQQAITYIRDHLDPSLQLRLEYSNEVWNWGFSQSGYAQSMAQSLWGPSGTAMEYFGYRSAQIAAISESVFGAAADDRLINVLSSQTAWKGLEQQVFDGAQKAGVGDIGGLFESWAITGYFSGGLTGSMSDDEWNSVLSWARSGSAGLDKAFQQIEHGDLLAQWGSLQELNGLYAYQAAVAAKYGWTLDAYEGGQHLTAQNAPAAIRDEIVAFFKKIVDDPRMGTLYAKNLALFDAAGGDNFNQYTDVGAASLWGQWGSLDSIYDSGSARWDVYKALIDAATRSDIDVAAPVFDLVGSDRNDTLKGTARDETIFGGKGDDSIDGGDGNDSMTGGLGNDRYTVASLGDIVVEDADGGDDMIVARVDYVMPAHVEKLILTGAATTAIGNDLKNTIYGNHLGTMIDGAGGDDSIGGGIGRDTLYGSGGDDHVNGKAGNDSVYGGDGVDWVYGGEGDDIVDGGAGDDHVLGEAGDDLLYGSAGDDDIYGGDGHDMIDAGVGADKVRGGLGDDGISGGNGSDWIYGEEGADHIDGGADADYLYGALGDDILIGGVGRDMMTGGAGKDIFVFRADDFAGLTWATSDVILDFSVAQRDRIDLSEIDARPMTGADDSFSFLGTAAFTNRAGELRYVPRNGAVQVSGDLDGDGAADFSISVRGISVFDASYFIL